MKTQWLQTTSVVHWPSSEENIIYTAMNKILSATTLQFLSLTVVYLFQVSGFK